jgi:MbtH protein
MQNEDKDDLRQYKVVINQEEQYSVWFDTRTPPAGWREVGKRGTKAECLAYIEEVWTDMRPLSVRKAMEQAGDEVSRGVN